VLLSDMFLTIILGICHTLFLLFAYLTTPCQLHRICSTKWQHSFDWAIRKDVERNDHHVFYSTILWSLRNLSQYSNTGPVEYEAET